LISSEAVVGLPFFEITDLEESSAGVLISVRYVGAVSCPFCEGLDLRKKDKRLRLIRHETWGTRRSSLRLESSKWLCRDCGRFFWQRFQGILPRRRSTEPFRKSVSIRHLDGINRSRLGMRESIGSATVERWLHDHLGREVSKRKGAACPRILGIDEHFFTRKQGFATTLCNLALGTVFDVVLGRSEASLEGYLKRLPGKEKVEVICMDLSQTYRSLARAHFPNARIVADRFHVIRLVNHHFLACWKQIDPIGSRNRGLVSLMRRHPENLRAGQGERLGQYLAGLPGLQSIYEFKQRLCELLLIKHQTQRQCKALIPRFLDMVQDLIHSGLAPLVQLGETLQSWAQEIVTMWRFTKNNGITEGFHNKMENLKRQAYGFRNFENYRLRVRVTCS
jgi:transposase